MPAKILRCCLLFMLLILAILGSMHFYMAAKSTMFLATHGHQDTYIFVSAAQRLFSGGKLYELIEPLYISYAPGMAVFKFPPIYVLPYLPFLDVLQGSQEVRWYTYLYQVHLLRYGLTAFLVYWFLGPRRKLAWFLSVVAVFGLAAPVYESLYGMTFENILLMLLVLSLMALKLGGRWVPSVFLSYISLAKLYPAPVVLFLATRDRWKGILIFGLCSVFWLIVAVMLLGVESHADFYTKILPILLHEDANIGPMNRTLLYDPIVPAVARPFLLAGLVVVTALVLNCRAFKMDAARNLDLEFCLVLPMTLLMMKNCWVQYQIMLLLPILVLIGGAMDSSQPLRWLRGFVAVGAFIPLLSSIGYPDIQLPYFDWLVAQEYGKALVDKLDSARRFSSLILWAGIALLLILEMLRKPLTLTSAR